MMHRENAGYRLHGAMLCGRKHRLGEIALDAFAAL